MQRQEQALGRPSQRAANGSQPDYSIHGCLQGLLPGGLASSTAVTPLSSRSAIKLIEGCILTQPPSKNIPSPLSLAPAGKAGTDVHAS